MRREVIGAQQEAECPSLALHHEQQVSAQPHAGRVQQRVSGWQSGFDDEQITGRGAYEPARHGVAIAQLSPATEPQPCSEEHDHRGWHQVPAPQQLRRVRAGQQGQPSPGTAQARCRQQRNLGALRRLAQWQRRLLPLPQTAGYEGFPAAAAMLDQQAFHDP